MNFNHPKLLAIYGNWIRVQVAFYDFIFTEANNLCPTHMKEKLISEFRDGADYYETLISAVEQSFPTFSDAWTAFLIEEGINP